MHPATKAPDPVSRPKLAHFIWERGLDFRAAGKLIGLSYEAIRSYCLPWSSADRHVPNRSSLAKIVAWTEGAVTAADFYPPALNGTAPADAPQAAQ